MRPVSAHAGDGRSRGSAGSQKNSIERNKQSVDIARSVKNMQNLHGIGADAVEDQVVFIDPAPDPLLLIAGNKWKRLGHVAECFATLPNLPDEQQSPLRAVGSNIIGDLL